MSVLPSALRRSGASPSTPGRATRRIAVVRAAAALIWAGLLVAAVGDDVPTTATELPALVALLLTAYPLIDVVASMVEASTAPPRDAAVLRANAALSTLAVVALGIAALGGDAGSALVAFGAWAFASGAVQLGVALRRRGSGERQLPMVVSGALSAIAGVTFAASAGQDAAHLANLGGYAAVGAILYLVWAARTRH